MKKYCLLVVVLLFGLNTSACESAVSDDKSIFERVIDELQKKNYYSTAKLVTAAGKLLINTPYIAQTLEIQPEQLVVNLQGFDCTTFAENCLALARTAKNKNPSFEIFKNELQLIRYRGGVIDGYPSRLHYFSDWLIENDKKQIIRSVLNDGNANEFRKTINFMSQHPQSYKPLENNAIFLENIKAQEKHLSDSTLYYIPTEKLNALNNLIKDGDILGITTNIEGLDIIHVGIAHYIAGELHMIHASSKAGKVIVSDETLYEYLLQRKSATGIMLARPL